MPRIQPPTYFFASVVLMLLLHWLLPLWHWLAWPWTLLGLIPALAGAYLGQAGSSTFRRVGTTIVPGQVSSTLVTTGVFGFTRNPMYLSFTLLLVGLGVLLGSLSPLVVIPIFIIIINQRIIPIEERMLTEKFGAEYADYQRRVRRWI